MQSELRRILEEGKVTTFFVTHDQEEAMTLSDTIVVMRDGIIEETGTPHEVYERPANRFVAGFLGKANFIEDDGVTYAIRPGKVKIGMADDEKAKMHGIIRALVYSGNLTTCTVDCGKTDIVVEIADACKPYIARSLSRGAEASVFWNDSAQIRLADYGRKKMKRQCLVLGGLVPDVDYNASRWPKHGQDGFITGEKVVVGGCAVNMAVTAENLGLKAHVVSCVGDDGIGGQMVSYMEEHGLSVRFIRRIEGESGKCLVFVEPDGERTFLTRKGAEGFFPGELAEAILEERV